MKINGPLQSGEARGTVADVLTFSKRETGQQVRFQKKQKDVETVLRVDQRAKFLNASFACRFIGYGVAFYGASVYGHEKIFYNQKVENKPFTGYNLCVKEHIEIF